MIYRLILNGLLILFALQFPQGDVLGDHTLPMARNIAEGNLCAFYPMPGYSAVMSWFIRVGLEPMLWTFLFQLVLFNVTYFVLLRLLGLKENWKTALMMVPLAATMGPLWNLAPVPFLLTLSLFALKEEKEFSSAFCASMCYWFRPELVLLPLGYALLKKMKVFWFWMLPLAFITIWMCLQLHNGIPNPSPGSANSSGIFYSSLGLVPGNPLDIDPNEATGARVVAARYGFRSPWTPEASPLFWNLSKDAIRSNPLVFVEKVAHNIVAQVFRGFYVGDWSAWSEWPLRGLKYIINGAGIFWGLVLWWRLFWRRGELTDIQLFASLGCLLMLVVVGFFMYESKYSNLVYVLLLFNWKGTEK